MVVQDDEGVFSISNRQPYETVDDPETVAIRERGSGDVGNLCTPTPLLQFLPIVPQYPCGPAYSCEAIACRNVVGGELAVHFYRERLHRGQILLEPYPDAVVHHAAEILEKREMQSFTMQRKSSRRER